MSFIVILKQAAQVSRSSLCSLDINTHTVIYIYLYKVIQFLFNRRFNFNVSHFDVFLKAFNACKLFRMTFIYSLH